MTDLSALIKRHPELKKVQEWGAVAATYIEMRGHLKMCDAALAEALTALEEQARRVCRWCEGLGSENDDTFVCDCEESILYGVEVDFDVSCDCWAARVTPEEAPDA